MNIYISVRTSNPSFIQYICTVVILKFKKRTKKEEKVNVLAVGMFTGDNVKFHFEFSIHKRTMTKESVHAHKHIRTHTYINSCTYSAYMIFTYMIWFDRYFVVTFGTAMQ